MRIYHTSDLHDHGGFARRLRELRERDPGLLFDCGDSLRGSQTVYHKREPIIEEIDAAGYDAQAIGNREFHYVFGLLRARAKQMHHPLVCTNLLDTKGRDLPFVRSLMLERDGVRVHVLGLLVMQYPVGSPWERFFGWRFLAPPEAIAAYAKNVPEGDMLVVLSHVGLSLDRKLALAVPRIDLILGGHSHDTLAEPAYVGDVPILHAGPYGRYVSRTGLAYDAGARRFRITDFALVPLLGAA
ncbi:MAG TPA: metallophosphoesterase [Candidatus Baltobacteraceae bacterium]|jgi:2',3'-cyclic-nucleotide 2'-phosphodiesterase (5'-nucleotidase family)